MDTPTTVLQSHALYLGEIEVRPKVSSRKRFRSAPLKKAAAAHLHAWFRRAPRPLASAYLGAAAAFARGAYAVPGNRLREACEHVSALSRRAGLDVSPGEVYARFVSAARLVLDSILRLYHGGPEAMLDRIRIGPETQRSLLVAAASGHGGMIAVPHNVGAVVAATKIARVVPTVLISRNSASAERTRISLDLYERMGVTVLMVRDANPFALSRACLRAMSEGRVMVATVDRIDRSPQQVAMSFLGRSVGFGAWAARLAVRAGVPLVPAWVGTTRREMVVETGEPFVGGTTEEGMRHYLDYFERRLLEGPWDWSFLADRRWRRVLADAAGDAAHGISAA